ncbi:thioredoxin [Coriobacteriales bacterium OH1046]|nr:thioredoxin [Coriobacteriales bacterium OH1046]
MSQQITAQSFDEVIASSTLPVLVDFWAPWCGPCRALGPTLEQVAEEHASEVAVYKCNVDEESDLAARFNIVSIPTLILFKDGKPAHTIMGNRPKADLEKEILTHL